MNTVILLFTFLGASAPAAPPPRFPEPAQRQAMLRALAAEMERLDGEGLYVRRNRAGSWASAVDSLAGEAAGAQDFPGLIRAFARLDAAYPNLHAYFEPGEDFAALERPGVEPELAFETEWLSPGMTRVRLSVVEGGGSGPDQPRVGDELLAINGRPVSEWLGENFEFCKWPLREQCDLLFFWSFRSELLGWDRSQPLHYTLRRGEAIRDVPVALLPRAKRRRSPEDWLCHRDPGRYPGFSLAYRGNRACVFLKDGDPRTAVLRISSFQYRQLPEGERIRSVQQEVDALYPWWLRNGAFDHLIIDVADNGGGNAPVPYYQILFTSPFQEQWAELRKIPELLDPRLREGVLWGEPAQELWFQRLRSSGRWDAVPNGAYLPRFPMFCADDTRPCDEGLFPVREHPFRGRVSLILNPFCVSSCDGFVYALKEQLGARVSLVGQPQAADTAYSRLTIQLSLDPSGPEGYRLTVVPIRGENRAFIAQTVSVSRSVDSEGRVQSGAPLPIDRFVPSLLGESGSWIGRALSEALRERAQFP